MNGDSNDPIIAISYSLPHIISASLSILIIGYLTLLYINTYKWKAEEFGKVFSLQFLSVSISQSVLALLFQFVVVSPDEFTGLRNCKIVQVINIIIYSVSFFFIVLLPILKIKYSDRIIKLEDPESADKKNDLQHTIAWMFYNTKWYFYIIGLLWLAAGYGYGSYEIHDRLIPTYIAKDTTYLSSINDLIKGLSICSSVLLVLFLNKLLKNKYPDYMPFLAISTILLVLLVPVSVVFYMFTQKSSSGSAIDASDVVPATANLDYPVLGALLVLETISAVLFLTFPIIIQYITIYFLDDYCFGIGASAIYLLFYFLGSVFYRAFAYINLPKKTVSYLCVACYSIGYLLLLPHKYSWNKKGVIYYVVIAVFNMVSMVGFINTNIMITNQLADDNHKKYRWLIQGCICSVKNIFLYFFMKFVYSTYDKEGCEKEDKDERKIPSFKLNFRNLFVIIFLACQVIGVIATVVYKEHVFN